jgi:dTDP-4-dehydrorhamnose reductase
MKLAIIGADGQLGSDLVKILSAEKIFPLYYPEFDITKPDKAERIISSLDLEIVINTAAYHRVDECEENPRESFQVNAEAVRDLALICREHNLTLMHFSTDYVFNGKKRTPYVEEDIPYPLSVYGVSKLAGEYFVRNILERYFLVRTCGLYGEAGCWGKGTNFVDAMISSAKKGQPLKVVNDQRVTPTSTKELAHKIDGLIQTSHYGLFHLTNEGHCTWYEFAAKIFSLMSQEAHLIPVDSKTFGARANRPAYSVLENKRAKKIGLSDFSHWTKALEDYLKGKGYIKKKE